MQTYIALLRGINVSGVKKINMKDLKTLFEELGFSNVRTYIQSGNVVFDSALGNAPELAAQIENCIRERYGFEVPVVVTTQPELLQVITANPFETKTGEELKNLYLVFLAQEPAADNLAITKALNFAPEEFIISGKTVYMFCPKGYGQTKLDNNFFERKLKVKATTRNWKTVNTLAKMAEPVAAEK